MEDISRRDATYMASMALLAGLLPTTALASYNSIPAGTGVAVGGRDAKQQMRANFGRDADWSSNWRQSRVQLGRNIQTVANYFNSDIVPNEYRRHYASYWREENWWEQSHVYYCVCCYLILRHLTHQTSFQRHFESQYIGNERFVWHYEVQWSNTTIEYVVDEWSRLRTLDSSGQMQSGFDGWVYYEQDRYVALGRRGDRVTRVRGLDSGLYPELLYSDSPRGRGSSY